MVRGEQLIPDAASSTPIPSQSSSLPYKVLPQNSKERQVFTDSVLTQRQAREFMRRRSVRPLNSAEHSPEKIFVEDNIVNESILEKLKRLNTKK